ncbi:MAG: NADH-quinone oxidoreductase subunit J [Holosporales bacterium]
MLTAVFYVFASLLVLGALGVIAARNPVHAVLFLIFSFFNAAALFLLTGAEFLAMLLVIVYVGAVAVLFLFVVMMLDVDFAALKKGVSRNLPIGLAIGGLLLAELVLIYSVWPQLTVPQQSPSDPISGSMTNTEALGHILYDKYLLAFQGSGLILLVAMIGAIVLTLRPKDGRVKRQNIADQVARRPSDAMEIIKVESGKGVDI